MVYEVTQDKKLVWSFADHAQFKTVNQIQILDTPVDVIHGEIYPLTQPFSSCIALGYWPPCLP
ncbi:MAG: hypothetical protein R3F31_01590 [Verrucomicrobiales bacterium]